jgi:hypothetical protein
MIHFSTVPWCDDRRRIVVVERRVDWNSIRYLRSALGACRGHASGGVDEEPAPVLVLREVDGAGEGRRHLHDAAKSLLFGVQGGKGRNHAVGGQRRA